MSLYCERYCLLPGSVVELIGEFYGVLCCGGKSGAFVTLPTTFIPLTQKIVTKKGDVEVYAKVGVNKFVFSSREHEHEGWGLCAKYILCKYKVKAVVAEFSKTADYLAYIDGVRQSTCICELGIVDIRDSNIRGVFNDALLATESRIESIALTTTSLDGFDTGLRKQRSLRELLVRKLPRENIAADVDTLNEVLSHNKNIVELSLYFNRIGDELGVVVAQTLSACSPVKLVLHDNDFEQNFGNCLGVSLSYSNQLRDLNLRSCEIGPVIGNNIMNVLSKHHPFLNHLNLSRTGLEGEIIAEGIYNILTKLKFLHKLDLSCNILWHHGAASIGKGLLKNESLRQLNMKLCHIFVDRYRDSCPSEEEVSALTTLVHGLKGHPTMKELNFSGNYIHDVGIIAICEVIRGSQTLERLILSRCDCGKDGAVAIANALKQNKALRFLLLGSNALSTEGAIAICEVLANNTTIERLSFQECPGVDYDMLQHTFTDPRIKL